MDHQQAITTQAAERYTLNELPAGEREAFEEHYFSCAECADAVRSCTILAVHTEVLAKEERNRPSRAGQFVAMPARPVRPAAREWFAAVAAVLLLGLAGFQNLVTIPRLARQASLPGPLQSVLLRPPARGSSASVAVHTEGNTLDVELDGVKAGASYEVVVRRAAGPVVNQFIEPRSIDGTLHVRWSPNMEPGEYEILVRDVNAGSAEPVVYSLHVER